MTEHATQHVGEVDDDALPVLEVRDLAVHFGGVKAVDGISFRLMPGLISGIIGPNGSGKSTAIGAITRLTPLTRGQLLLGGEDYGSARASTLARRGVARTFQTVRLLSELTVAENVRIGADVGSRSGRSTFGSTTQAVADALRRTGLDGYEDDYPSELSYGTQRRVEIARAIAMAPRLLLLDEPTAGMNKAERTEISQLLKDLRSEGLCQLLVEHDVQMMLDTCDHLYAMNLGRLVAEGRPADVVREPQVVEAYLGRRFSRVEGA